MNDIIFMRMSSKSLLKSGSEPRNSSKTQLALEFLRQDKARYSGSGEHVIPTAKVEEQRKRLVNKRFSEIMRAKYREKGNSDVGDRFSIFTKTNTVGDMKDPVDISTAISFTTEKVNKQNDVSVQMSHQPGFRYRRDGSERKVSRKELRRNSHQQALMTANYGIAARGNDGFLVAEDEEAEILEEEDDNIMKTSRVIYNIEKYDQGFKGSGDLKKNLTSKLTGSQKYGSREGTQSYKSRKGSDDMSRDTSDRSSRSRESSKGSRSRSSPWRDKMKRCTNQASFLKSDYWGTLENDPTGDGPLSTPSGSVQDLILPRLSPFATCKVIAMWQDSEPVRSSETSKIVEEYERLLEWHKEQEKLRAVENKKASDNYIHEATSWLSRSSMSERTVNRQLPTNIYYH